MGEMKGADVEATVGNPVCGDVMKIYLKIGGNREKKVAQGEKGELAAQRGFTSEVSPQRGPSTSEVNTQVITDIKFQTLGCGAAIATSSIITEMAKGKTLEEAEKIDAVKIVKELGNLPTPKIHCSVLAAEALKKAIKKYRKTTG